MTWRSWALLVFLAPACGGKAVIDGDDSSRGGGGAGGAPGGGKIESLVVKGALVYVNCQPVPPSDPLDVSLGLEYFNSGQEDALFEFAGGLIRDSGGTGAATTFTFTLNNVYVGPGEGVIELNKSPGSSQGTPPCDWCGQTNVALTVSMTIDGVGRTVDENVDSVSCTF